MIKDVRLNVNGKEHTLQIDPATPLLYPLRNELELNGPKFGCGLEQCGSCMVLLDGMAEPSCMRTCSSLEGVEIRTIESLADGEKLDPIQEAFIELQAAQCGYCVNGMVISAKSLLEKNPNPADEEIKEGLQRVLCRCGTHSRFIKAVRLAAEKMKSTTL
ncbi:(2Fe-2S)-binding protein [Litoribacter ruber]|uniref:(2Fe-2S)-binding protein n=1 Tax=Litoribacter ruber TaxID=702568 RepID=A0AAP2CFE9_9BACT|nr:MULTISPECIES: (2Fe-2S)-binding protein [Litoribacter]MBS9522715.1 (2Fe-2S)-binding protein [Litoribacter alkaliphilus]MBT0811245.1 (2Fe-2S)-binding protein [Litoribacter ruber]